MKLIALAAALLFIFLWRMTPPHRSGRATRIALPAVAFNQVDPTAPTGEREPVFAVYAYAPEDDNKPMDVIIVLGGKEIPLEPGYKFTLKSARECSTLIPGLGWRGGYVRHTINLSGEGFSGGRPRIDPPNDRTVW